MRELLFFGWGHEVVKTWIQLSCEFKPCCSLQLRENSESLWEFCCCAGTFLAKYAVTYVCEFVLYSSVRNVLLPISVNLCCIFPGEKGGYLYLLTCGVSTLGTMVSIWILLSYTSAKRTPMYLHYSLYSWRKSEQVFPRDIFRHVTLPNFFFYSFNTPFFEL